MNLWCCGLPACCCGTGNDSSWNLWNWRFQWNLQVLHFLLGCFECFRESFPTRSPLLYEKSRNIVCRSPLTSAWKIDPKALLFLTVKSFPRDKSGFSFNVFKSLNNFSSMCTKISFHSLGSWLFACLRAKNHGRRKFPIRAFKLIMYNDNKYNEREATQRCCTVRHTN